jgi:hypothetical protein
MLVGYARVSTPEQNHDLQRTLLGKLAANESSPRLPTALEPSVRGVKQTLAVLPDLV